MNKATERSDFQPRSYRRWVKADDLCRQQITLYETDLQILTDRPLDTLECEQKIKSLRRDIGLYISKVPGFQSALKPVTVSPDAPVIVRRMAAAARLSGVGPMAAVAGAIAGELGKFLLRKKYREVIIENGGDVFIAGSQDRRVGIFTGKESSKWNNLSFRISSEDLPLGVCASAGSFGHSLSFGKAESVIVFSRDAALADAAATAICNRVGSENDLEEALKFGRKISGISGVVVICGKNLASWGKIEFVS